MATGFNVSLGLLCFELTTLLFCAVKFIRFPICPKQIGTVQVQMKSKGGYSENSNDLHNYTPGGIPVGGASGNNL